MFNKYDPKVQFTLQMVYFKYLFLILIFLLYLFTIVLKLWEKQIGF